LHRPIRFEGFAALAKQLKPTELDYWLAYWIAAFEHVARRRERIHVVHYEDICRRGVPAAAELCELLGFETFHAPAMAAHFEPRPALAPGLDAHRSPLRDRAEALYRKLIGG
jgi:hypothetical protein